VYETDENASACLHGGFAKLATAEQLPFMEDVLSHTDVYFSECLVDSHCYLVGKAAAGLVGDQGRNHVHK
jgi:hypothetical protein